MNYRKAFLLNFLGLEIKEPIEGTIEIPIEDPEWYGKAILKTRSISLLLFTTIIIITFITYFYSHELTQTPGYQALGTAGIVAGVFVFYTIFLEDFYTKHLLKLQSLSISKEQGETQ